MVLGKFRRTAMAISNNKKIPQILSKSLTASAILVGLYLTSFINYLLFHSLVELFSIVVAFGLFMIAWNSKAYIKNPYLLFIGIAYFFIGALDLLHTLSYKGMPIFTDYDYYANQLWIAARFMESLSLLFGFLFLRTNRKIAPTRVLMAYAALTGLLISTIFYWKVFPVCFVEGVGLTPFKKISEYLIIIILLINIFLLRKNKERFESRIHQLILLSFIFSIVSELAFTVYVSNYGVSNLVGHYFKLFSFYLIYRAIIETCIGKPYELIFRELDVANKKLNDEIQIRTQIETEQQKLIIELRHALNEIKTLRGIIPICAQCKKIRDDQGYWNQIELYVRNHSEAEFSHSLCPDCAEALYGKLKDPI